MRVGEAIGAAVILAPFRSTWITRRGRTRTGLPAQLDIATVDDLGGEVDGRPGGKDRHLDVDRCLARMSCVVERPTGGG